MTLEVAEEFYRRCDERQAKTRDEREAVLFELANEGKMNYVAETKRTMEQYIEDTAKHFSILHIKPTEDSDESTN
jgi:hypothetical protein